MVEADFEPPVEVAVGDTVTLSFSVEDQGDIVEAFGYSLSGGFGAISARVFEGRVSLDWFAPEELEGSESSSGCYQIQMFSRAKAGSKNSKLLQFG